MSALPIWLGVCWMWVYDLVFGFVIPAVAGGLGFKILWCGILWFGVWLVVAGGLGFVVV